MLPVTTRQVVWLLFEQLLRLEFLPVLHRLQGRLAAEGRMRQLLVVEPDKRCSVDSVVRRIGGGGL